MTNTSHNYGIYAYCDKITDTIVYIGKDSHIDSSKRDKNHMASCHYDNQTINRVLQDNLPRYDYMVLKTNLSSVAEMDYWEQTLIGRFNPIFNFTNGGDGVGGYRKTRTNKTGILHVGIRKNKKLKQGFCYRYEYRTKNKTYEFHSTSIKKLEQKVKEEGLGWVIIDKEKARQTYALN